MSGSGGRTFGERTFSSRLLGKAPLNILANIELPSCAKPCATSTNIDTTLACLYSPTMRPRPARSDHDDTEARGSGLGELRATGKAAVSTQSTHVKWVEAHHTLHKVSRLVVNFCPPTFKLTIGSRSQVMSQTQAQRSTIGHSHTDVRTLPLQSILPRTN